jgi:MraZ protein
MPTPLLLGEHRRTLDERHRVSIPAELVDAMLADKADCILAKERVGALSLWQTDRWQSRLEQGVKLVQDKIEAGRLDGRLAEVQQFGRLLSTRHTSVRLAGRGRLAIPEGFRDFLGVEPGGDMLVIGASVCVELWRPDIWFTYIESHMPDFGQLFDDLSG